MTQITRALSVRAPWWWAILHAGKDIENRSRSHSFRGRVWLHASKWRNDGEIADAVHTIMMNRLDAGAPGLRSPLAVGKMRQHGGHIVGSVEIVACVTESDSPCFFGPVGFVLRDPVTLAQPVPCKGALGFFPVPGDVLERLAA